jgi:hypothetical protein
MQKNFWLHYEMYRRNILCSLVEPPFTNEIGAANSKIYQQKIIYCPLIVLVDLSLSIRD